jgi:hypothetical protein
VLSLALPFYWAEKSGLFRAVTSFISWKFPALDILAGGEERGVEGHCQYSTFIFKKVQRSNFWT